jgi:hypothetical protein
MHDGLWNHGGTIMEFVVTLQQQAMNKPCLGASLVKASGLGFESPCKIIPMCIVSGLSSGCLSGLC